MSRSKENTACEFTVDDDDDDEDEDDDDDETIDG